MVASEGERVRKPINTRTKVRIIKVPPSNVTQYILVEPDDRRFMLDMPPGSTIRRFEEDPPDDETA